MLRNLGLVDSLLARFPLSTTLSLAKLVKMSEKL